VERAVARVLLSIGLLMGSLTLSAWWMQRTVLDPHQTSRMVGAVARNPEVRKELADVIGGAVAQQLGVPPTQVTALVNSRLESNTDLSFLGQTVADAQSRLMGKTTGPVELEPALLEPLIGQQLADRVGTVRWDVPTFEPMKTVDNGVSSFIGVGLIAAIGLVAAGFLLHPRKDRALRMVGTWAIGTCFWQLIVAYVFPVVVLPHLTDNPWVSIATALAQARVAPLFGMLLTLAGLGVACILVSLFVGSPRAARSLSQTASASSRSGSGAPLTAAVSASGSTAGGVGGTTRWPSTRASRRGRSFGNAHRRTTTGQDPDHDGDWLL
jgi:hypothetical protein